MANIKKTSDVKEFLNLKVKDRQDYLNNMSRQDALNLMRDIGYREGFKDGLDKASNKVSLVDEAIVWTDKIAWRTTILSIGIIVSFSFFIYKLVPTRLSLTLLGSITLLQIFFTLLPMVRKSRDDDSNLW